MFRVAAALAVVVTGTLTWRAMSGPDAAVPAARSFRAGAARPDTVRLPDGSQVVLAPRSELVVHAGYGGRERSVALSGLGYFDVVHDDTSPFTVRVGETLVRDVGTTFTVRADSARGVDVAVHSGTVLVSGSGIPSEGLVLHAGDRAGIGDSALVARGTVRDGDLAWTTGRLVFRDVPLDEVAREVGRWHGVRFAFDAALGNRRLNGDFTGRALDEVVQAMTISLGLRSSREGDLVRLETTELRER